MLRRWYQCLFQQEAHQRCYLCLVCCSAEERTELLGLLRREGDVTCWGDHAANTVPRVGRAGVKWPRSVCCVCLKQ